MKYFSFYFCWFLLACSTPESDVVVDTVYQRDSLTETTMVQEWDSIICRECLYENLSEKFNYHIVFTRFYKGKKYADSIQTIVMIVEKLNEQVVDTVFFQGMYDFPISFRDCFDTRSYITGFKQDQKIVDNYYGEFIVADFNFDSKEDFAVIRDEGRNGGVWYNFYIQGLNQNFELDLFLTDSMVYFPNEFNEHKKSLVTFVKAGVWGVGKNTYQYNQRSKSWKQVEHEMFLK